MNREHLIGSRNTIVESGSLKNDIEMHRVFRNNSTTPSKRQPYRCLNTEPLEVCFIEKLLITVGDRRLHHIPRQVLTESVLGINLKWNGSRSLFSEQNIRDVKK